MQRDTCEAKEPSGCSSSVRCESQQLLVWWAKLVHRILVHETMKPDWENCVEEQGTSAAFESPGVCLRPAVDSNAGLCEHRVHGAAIRLG
jgi:hypothetical protein